MNLIVAFVLAAVTISVYRCQESGYPGLGESSNNTAAAQDCAPQRDCDDICYKYSGTAVCSPPSAMVGCFCQIPNSDCPALAPEDICRFAPPDCVKFCQDNSYNQSVLCRGYYFDQCTCFCKNV